MKFDSDNNVLTVYLSGRIGANNAADIDAEISEVLAKNPGLTPTFDAEELEYISSAGLRVLLKFRKTFGKNLDVLNASSEVYDIFEVTGFTELLNVKKRLREIPLDGLEVIGGGAFSTVYRLDPETIIKVFDKRLIADKPITLADVENDRHASREIFTHDIPTAISYDVVRCGEYYGLVYEMIDADTLSATLSKHPERLEELSIKTARLFRKLHTTQFTAGTFPDARNKIRKFLNAACERGAVSAEDNALLVGIIDRIPYRNTLIHGDFHPKNIMVSGDDLILIDVGEAGLGNPIVEFMSTYMNFVTLSMLSNESERDFHKIFIGLDNDVLIAMWKIMMPEYFGTTDKDALGRYEQTIKGYSSICHVAFESVIPELPAKTRKSIIAAEISRIRETASTLRPIEGI